MKAASKPKQAVRKIAKPKKQAAIPNPAPTGSAGDGAVVNVLGEAYGTGSDEFEWLMRGVYRKEKGEQRARNDVDSADA